MTGRKRISIVSACRNEREHIRAFVDSLLAQDLSGFDWEIIVADGASSDGTREALADMATGNPRVMVIDNPGRIASTGLNAAIRAASGEIILRMDAHTEYARDYIQRCVRTLEASGAENVGGPARTKAEGLRGRAIQAAYHSRFSTGGARFHDDNYTGYVDTVTYGCWRKETLLRLGLFDEGLVRNQDDELNLRLIRAGGKIWQSVSSASHAERSFPPIFPVRILEGAGDSQAQDSGILAALGSRRVRDGEPYLVSRGCRRGIGRRSPAGSPDCLGMVAVARRIFCGCSGRVR
jgi:glycosyltransferase involved in cell wall biosynthesis